ncbi:YcnI family protein [Microbacterium capsulatum]|uniref:YcnI family protein n=1 Tax=Microbacterium capsulatum TaxID=3041921 RepID=A0ABU0XQ20_9MICO|nr:YcnI family protein [Microbacterium sp. ASV81]MDQ4215870.1 YcnI family protein [Microbacterium sp. ASV81]
MRKTTLQRALIGLAAGAALALVAPLAASAHVTATPNQAEAGSWTYVTFRVPNESATASTVKLEIHLPTDTPFTSVSYQPTAGWTGATAKTPLPKPVKVEDNTVSDAVTTVTFTADAGGVAPGQFQAFTLSLGPVPDTGHIVMAATQTYSDGKVVEWSATPEQVAKDDTLEPAPVLWVNDAPPADHHGGATAAPAASGPSAPSDGRGGLALGLSIAALVIAAGGALLGAFALGRRRRGA